MSSTVLAAIPKTPPIVITGWLELSAHLDSLLPLHSSHQVLVTTDNLMSIWCVAQSTVSRRIAGINKAGLASIEHATGYRGCWWVKR